MATTLHGRPDPGELAGLCNGVDDALIREHLERLGVDYFESFTLEDVAAHVRSLGALSAGSPVALHVEPDPDGRVTCTVLAFDAPGIFALITGVLAALGFSIESGNVHTYARKVSRQAGKGLGRRRPGREQGDRARIIDSFTGRLAEGRGSLAAWEADLRERLEAVLRLVESGGAREREQAKHIVNELVASHMSRDAVAAADVLYPVELEVRNDARAHTTLRIVSQDTPAFLYAMSSALAMQQISIESVRIRTVHGRIEDEMQVLDARGARIEDEERIGRLKLSVLLTKQFTYCLGQAPDPSAALSRFDRMVSDVLSQPDHGRWLDMFSDPAALRDLARILGASDYIWEDFVRLQYETLLPILGEEIDGGGERFTREALARRLDDDLEGCRSLGARRGVINAFKDRTSYEMDLAHILHGSVDVREFSERLTWLAEIVVDRSVAAVTEHLKTKHGTPRTVAGLEAGLAVLGLGKLGGYALGYASDIELMFVYADAGMTDGEDPIENSEFFVRVAEETRRFIHAKREGIFSVDLRLRPHGDSGPLACSLQRYCRYYGPGGEALAYERLALVRLRHVGGDAEIGQRLERLRDEFIYGGADVDVTQLRELRERQYREKAAKQLNAKFSPGALVDIEYCVQLLQVSHGARRAAMRTPRIHEALEALSLAGVLDTAESEALAEAYCFLRRLINGLRLLRGNAKDLYLPANGTLEYVHLARRMGYRRGEDLRPEERLNLEFEGHTAIVRRFMARHFGREALPDPGHGNIADLVLLDEGDIPFKAKVLSAAGFHDVARAYANLRRLAGEGAQRERFAWLVVLASDMLGREADPDMALHNWQRFTETLLSPRGHYDLLLAQPKRLELLLGIMAGSQFLADTLIRHPGLLNWVTDPATIGESRRRERHEGELRALLDGTCGESSAWDAARRYRRREILRIGTRDICLSAPLTEITADLSALAEAIADVMLEEGWRALVEEDLVAEADRLADGFCVVALGKLGGGELNYSSDIDLLGVYDPSRVPQDDEQCRKVYHRVLERLRRALTTHTAEGYIYRVDFRLRPDGGAGEFLVPLPSLIRYYRERAQPWELQALLKARPIAGNLRVGRRFLAGIDDVLRAQRDWDGVRQAVRAMREKALAQAKVNIEFDVKTGIGGIRDIEFMVQALQLRYLAEHAELKTGNTLDALRTLQGLNLLTRECRETLEEDYIFLRRIEHYLQILEDRQVHHLPEGERERATLARRLFGPSATAEMLMDRLESARSRVRAAYDEILGTDTQM